MAYEPNRLQLVAGYQGEASLKDAELRALVGDSYRDVLASADAIGSFAAQCQRVQEILEGVSGLISAQEKRRAEEDAVGASEGASTSAAAGSNLPDSPKGDRYDDYYELASDVKAIVDSQEAIYSYLDNAQFLSAAVRHLEAVALYRKTAPVVKSKGVFPFLGHAWPGIKGLDIEVYEKAKGRVIGGEVTGAWGVADALAACGVLRPVEGVDLLGYYLEGRKHVILGDVDGSRGAPSVDTSEPTVASVSGLGVDLLAKMWESAGVAMVVFGEGLYLGSLVDVLGGVHVVDGEAVAAQEGSSLLIHLVQSRQISADETSELMRVSNSLLQLENEAWLKQMAESVRRDVFLPVLEGVSDCRQLRQHVELIEEAERGGRMFGELTWVELSRVATGQVISLWDIMGRDAVVARGKAILRERFDVALDVSAGLDREAFRAFDGALGRALTDSIECVRIDTHVFEEVVAEAFGGLMERTMASLEEAVSQAGASSSSAPSLGRTLGVVQFTSMLETQSEAYRRLLYVQHLGAEDDQTDESSSVLLPWARETSKRVGTVRDGATRAWAAAYAASILDDVCEDSGSGEGTSSHLTRDGTPAVANATAGSDAAGSLATPMYPSEWLTRALTQFCGALEGTVSSKEDLTRLSMETFKGALVDKLQARYAAPDASLGRSMTLQHIYDVKFVSMLSWGERGERREANDVTIRQMLRDLVTTMDPVEWEEHRASIESNARRYTHHVSSYLRTSTELTVVGKADGTATGDAGNLELANASSARFAYLPAKLPSRTPRPSSAHGSGLGLGPGAGLGDLPVAAAAAEEDAFSIAGLQGLAKAKAAEVSDFFSFL